MQLLLYDLQNELVFFLKLIGVSNYNMKKNVSKTL